ncbi:MAG: CBS domain-containing protein, partial [Methanosarcinales archaeon]|nr:CBS domain-containing protein [Methanosarcinales archaeon]
LPSPLEIIEIPIRELLGWEDAKASLEDIGSKPISTIMASKVHTIAADDTIEHASTLMVKHRVNRLPVVDDADKLVGIVTRGDIIQAVAGAGI